MSAPGGWFVLVEETGSVESAFVVSKTIPVDGGAEEAWDAALEFARSHERFPGSRTDCTREVYRLSGRVLAVVLRSDSGYVRESFRVSVAELAEIHEPSAPQEGEESGNRRRLLWPRSRTC